MDLFALIAAERLRLADELELLSPDDWAQPSLCDGWTTHVVAAHLNAPWEIKVPTVLIGIVRHRGSIDRAFDQMALDLARRLPPGRCAAGLREHAGHRFTPPMMGPEAPLTDVIVHGNDILAPLGRSVAVAPDALRTSLAWLAKGDAKGFLPRSRVQGLAFEATDVDLRCGSGPAVVSGPALAVITTLLGRRSGVDQLAGDGLALLLERL
ncbi:MAG: maleylpyruvate isomerase family mycothiol-dependent enzyme [Acidimicrobiales bacterium]|nr:maleylpyruvate isomerase family mycothiol-dependent enzyme [Actinomycetota bacterium]